MIKLSETIKHSPLATGVYVRKSTPAVRNWIPHCQYHDCTRPGRQTYVHAPQRLLDRRNRLVFSTSKRFLLKLGCFVLTLCCQIWRSFSTTKMPITILNSLNLKLLVDIKYMFYAHGMITHFMVSHSLKSCTTRFLCHWPVFWTLFCARRSCYVWKFFLKNTCSTSAYKISLDDYIVPYKRETIIHQASRIISLMHAGWIDVSLLISWYSFVVLVFLFLSSLFFCICYVSESKQSKESM